MEMSLGLRRAENCSNPLFSKDVLESPALHILPPRNQTLQSCLLLTETTAVLPFHALSCCIHHCCPRASPLNAATAFCHCLAFNFLNRKTRCKLVKQSWHFPSSPLCCSLLYNLLIISQDTWHWESQFFPGCCYSLLKSWQ